MGAVVCEDDHWVAETLENLFQAPRDGGSAVIFDRLGLSPP